MLTFVTVNVAPLAALDALLDGDDEDGDEEAEPPRTETTRSATPSCPCAP